MIIYLWGFIPNLSEMTSQMRDLLEQENEFTRTAKLTQSLNFIKEKVCQTPIIKIFNSTQKMLHKIVACFIELRKPVAYSSHSLSRLD